MKLRAFDFAVALVLMFASRPALCFPEMIGQGYQRCASCHYETGGGGPTNSYGKGIAEEMSTWSYEGEGGAFYGFLDVSPVGIHGDFRHIAYRYEDDFVTVRSHFPMQREMSLSLDASENISLLMSCGYYGYGEASLIAQCRRYFATLSAGPLRFRGGRFLPAFGINIPDHTKAVKELFGQGKESLNAEMSVGGKLFEVVFTRMFGRDGAGVKSGDRPTVLAGAAGDGFAIKSTLFLARGLQAGYSFAEVTEDGGSTTDTMSAYHAFFGTSRLALQAEYQQFSTSDKAYGSIGLKPLKGLWVKLEADYRADRGIPEETEIFGTIQFFPRPHHEFLLSGSEKRVMFISHFYL